MKNSLWLVVVLLLAFLVNTENTLAIDPCMVLCDPGCSISLVTNITANTLSQGRILYTTYVKWVLATSIGCSVGETCILAYCDMGFRSNTTGSNTYYGITSTNVDSGLRCTATNCWRSAPVINVEYTFSVIGGKVTNSYWQACIGDSTLLGTCNKVATAWFNVTALPGNINVTLISPATGSNYAQNNVMFNVTANNISVDNCSVYFNNTLNSTSVGNHSVNITFDQNESVRWQAKCCYSNKCNWNWNGNWTTRIDQWYNSIQWTPVNWSDLACRDWVVLGSNTTGSRVIDTQTYFVNGSGQGIVARNSTFNYTLQSLGRYLWTVETCAGEQCKNVTGIRWFHVQDNYHNAFQWTPLDNANLSGYDWVVLGANVTGNCTPNNMSYFVNKTNVANVPVNVTFNYTIPGYGIYNWQTQTCIIGFCTNVSIFNFYTQYYPSIIFVSLSLRQIIKYYIIDRSELYTEFKIKRGV